MARALIVGCGCRGRELGARLVADGWQVRGSSRTAEGAAKIEGAGLEAVRADPDRIASVLDHVAEVSVVGWMLGSAVGERDAVAAVHGARLERLLEELVDTPVRAFIYEGAGAVDARHLSAGAGIVRAASERWRIPVEVVDCDPGDADAWRDAMAGAFARSIS